MTRPVYWTDQYPGPSPLERTFWALAPPSAILQLDHDTTWYRGRYTVTLRTPADLHRWTVSIRDEMERAKTPASVRDLLWEALVWNLIGLRVAGANL